MASKRCPESSHSVGYDFRGSTVTLSVTLTSKYVMNDLASLKNTAKGIPGATGEGAPFTIHMETGASPGQ